MSHSEQAAETETETETDTDWLKALTEADSWFEIWIDGDAADICLARWNADEQGLVPTILFPYGLWDLVGGFIMDGNFILVPTWLERRLDGVVQGRMEVAERTLIRRRAANAADERSISAERGEAEARRQSRPDDVT